MKKWRIITGCWTEWVMIWMLREDFFPEQWTSSRWFSRQNQAAGWQPWWHPSLLSSCSYTTLPSSSMAVLALRLQPLCVAACDDVYCLIVWSHFFTLDDQSVGSHKKGSIGGIGSCEMMCAAAI